MDNYQELFDLFSNAEKKDFNILKIAELILDSIGWNEFSSVLEMKYTEGSSHYMGIYSTNNGLLTNEQWQFEFPREGYGSPAKIAKITLKNQGVYDLFNPKQNKHILELWLEYYKTQCKKNDIEIT